MRLNRSAIYPSSAPFVAFPSRRSVVHSTSGIVACTQPLAAQAGQRILRAGGNAADAAVAVAAALNVTEPCNTGIGGDLFCLFYDAETKTVRALNGSGRAPAALSLEALREELGVKDDAKAEIPIWSAYTVTVPGAAAGWVDVVEKFGSGSVSLTQVLQPAIELAEEGYPVSEICAHYWAASEGLIRKASPNFKEILKNGERAPKAGELFYNPMLAETFRTLGKSGNKGFYEGRVAEEIVKVVQKLGGHLSLEDLKEHAQMGSQEVEAISLDFKGQGVERGTEGAADGIDGGDDQGVRVWEHPPNGQGIIALMTLGILEELERTRKIRRFEEGEHNHPDYLHAVIEALRISFSDGNWWIADPDAAKVPAKELISRAYLAERAKLFDPRRASAPLPHGSPAQSHSDTVYFAVTDKWGNGASFINSNYTGFGTAIVPKGCGFTLQNRGANFVLQPGHPNAYAPRKRPYHTIIPAMVTNPEDGSLHSVYGVMGGFMQPQGHVQVLLNMVTFRLTPQAALDAPRICIGAGTPDAGDVEGRTVFLEEGISKETAEALERLGHQVQVVRGKERGLFGRGQVIRCHKEDGKFVYSAGSDPRGDGAALPV